MFGFVNLDIIANVVLIFLQYFRIDTFGQLAFKSKCVTDSISCIKSDIKFNILVALKYLGCGLARNSHVSWAGKEFFSLSWKSPRDDVSLKILVGVQTKKSLIL